MTQKRIARGSESGIRLENHLDEVEKRLGVEAFSGEAFGVRIAGSNDSLIKFLHVVGLEGRSEGNHLIQDAAQRPNVTLLIVGSILPNFRTRIVGRSCLSV